MRRRYYPDKPRTCRLNAADAKRPPARVPMNNNYYTYYKHYILIHVQSLVKRLLVVLTASRRGRRSNNDNSEPVILLTRKPITVASLSAVERERKFGTMQRHITQLAGWLVGWVMMLAGSMRRR